MRSNSNFDNSSGEILKVGDVVRYTKPFPIIVRKMPEGFPPEYLPGIEGAYEGLRLLRKSHGDMQIEDDVLEGCGNLCQFDAAAKRWSSQQLHKLDVETYRTV